MKKIILLIALVAFVLKSNAYVVSSTDGYDVNIEMTLDSISVTSGCSNGFYNYTVSYSYNISFTGRNAPTSLSSIHAVSTGSDGSAEMALPSAGGQGSASSSTMNRYNYDCATATPSSLGFDTIYLKLGGPGISDRIIKLHISALPVSLLHFTAKASNTHVALDWATASELNNDYFTIEKSLDGITFNELQNIKGAGTTNSITRYIATDVMDATDVYYRLKQTDFDGTYTHSPVVVVSHATSEMNKVTLYPNPNTTETIKLDVGKHYRHTFVSVSGLNGQVLQAFQPTGTVSEIQELPTGMYLVSIQNETTGQIKTLRLIQR